MKVDGTTIIVEPYDSDVRLCTPMSVGRTCVYVQLDTHGKLVFTSGASIIAEPNLDALPVLARVRELLEDEVQHWSVRISRANNLINQYMEEVRTHDR